MKGMDAVMLSDSPHYWFVPCNVKLYDVVKHFEESDKLTVKQGRKVAAGDYAYIYVGRPYSRILYRCVIEEAELCAGNLTENEAYAIPKGTNPTKPTSFMRLRADLRFDVLELSYTNLLENGMGTVQAQQSMPRKTLEYIRKFE